MLNMTFDVAASESRNGCAFSPDESLIATSGTTAATIYSRSGNAFTKLTFSSPSGIHLDCKFSPDGTKLVLLFDSDDTLYIRVLGVSGTTFTTLVDWQAVNANTLGQPAKCAFSADGTRFAVGAGCPILGEIPPPAIWSRKSILIRASFRSATIGNGSGA